MPQTTARVIFTMCTRIFNNRPDELRGNASNEDKGVKKACKELAGQCKKLIKDAENEATKHEKELKKHGVKDIVARCPSHSTTHSTVHKSTAKPHTTHSDAYNSEATPKHESHPDFKARPKTSHCSVFDMMPVVIYAFDVMCPIKYLHIF